MSIIKDGKELRAATFGFSESFVLRLQDQDELRINNILRIIPGRRMVVAGMWQNKRVVAKLFFDKRHAERHTQSEIAGINLLKERNIPSPALFQQTKSHDGHAFVLISEYLRADIDLMQAWQQHNIRDELMPLLKMLVVEIATQHVFGLEQRDLHLNNFLFANNVIYTIDGAQIELHNIILPKKQSMQNLALLLSQLGVDADKYQAELFECYINARGWIEKPTDLRDLFFMIDMWSSERWQKFERKIFRHSTSFHRVAHWYGESVCDRSYYQSELISLLKYPEHAFSHPDAVLLKNGRSATVIKLNLNGRDVVIKRYNIKNIWHWLRRCFRTTRAKKCWRIAQKLRLFGINTARPIAYIENRFLGLSGTSYFITENVVGDNVSDYLQKANEAQQAKIINDIGLMFTSLKKMAVTHGDLKATNLLINTDEEPVLIDLDGAHEHRTLSSLQRTTRKEWQRFLRNFDGASLILEKFEAVFGK